MTQYKFTELTERKTHVKQNNTNMKNSNKRLFLYFIVWLSVINTRYIRGPTFHEEGIIYIMGRGFDNL